MSPAKKTNKNNPERDPKFVAAVKLLERTGADEFQIRYCEEEKPVVWMAIARWGSRWETSAAMNPFTAVFRLCDQVIDGGTCQYCNRPTGFDSDTDPMPMDVFVCWYQWDPQTKEFRRGCDEDRR